MFYLAHGVMFLGTPHRGSSIAELATTAQRAPKALWKHPNLAILEALQVDSKVLERVHKGFSETVYERPEIGLQSFHEEYRTKGVLVVPPFSSVIGFPTELSGSIPAKHSNMTKFCEPTDTGFVRITGTLRHWIAEIVTDVADMNWVTLNLLGDEMAFTVAYPSEETIKSVPSKPSWLQLLTQYKGSFRQDDTTLANEMQRVIRKEIKHTTRSVSVIEVWRILSAEVSHREPSLPFNIMPIIVNGMRFNTETHAQSKPTTLLTE